MRRAIRRYVWPDDFRRTQIVACVMLITITGALAVWQYATGRSPLWSSTLVLWCLILLPPVVAGFVRSLKGRNEGGVTIKRIGEAFHPVCIACGYNLSGVESNACPECGKTLVEDPLCPWCGYNIKNIESERCPECGNVIGDISSEQAPPFGTLDSQCAKCKHDLRSTSAARCPKCTWPRSLRLEFNVREMPRVQEILRLHRLNHDQPPLDFLDMVRGESVGVVWIDCTRWPEAQRAFEGNGIRLRERGRPIVDRAEPMCPRCGLRLDPRGAEVCSRCRCEFTWVDINNETEQMA